MASVIVLSDMRDYFRGPLADVQRRQRLTITEPTQRYLLDLLVEGPTSEEALALLLQRAVEAHGLERVAALKQLGDVALYTAGYWRDTLNDAMMGVDYYAQMGRRAYDTLAGTTRHSVFGELAAKFARLIELLSELYERTALQGPEGLLKLYERYLRTGEERLRWRIEAEHLAR